MQVGLGDLETAVGVAYCGYVPNLVLEEPGLLDYVEVPVELLMKNSKPSELSKHVPIVLHCASLSIAGNVLPSEALWTQIEHWIQVTNTPWVGEHLAFVRASKPSFEPSWHDYTMIVDSDSGAYDIGYTVSPQYSQEVLNRVVRTLEKAQDRFSLPVLLENGPVYVSIPGSTMSQVEFINSLCDQLPSAQLLLDLSHLEITAKNLNLDPFDLLAQFPVERVVEVHMSGNSSQSEMYWDDHSQRASQVLFDLLEKLLTRARPRAVTLEYNWDSHFQLTGLRDDIQRVREIIRN